MKTGLDYFLADVKTLTKQRPPYNDAFTSRCVNVLGTAITIIEGLKIVIDKQKAEIDHIKGVKFERIKGIKASTNLEREAVIVSDFKSGMKKGHIAAKFKVTPARISQILTRNGFPPVPYEGRK